MYPEPKDEEPHREKGRPNNHLQRPKAVDANSKHLRRESSVVNEVGMYPEHTKMRNLTGKRGGQATICNDRKRWMQTGKAFDVKVTSLPEGYQVIGRQGVKLNAGRWQRETDQS